MPRAHRDYDDIPGTYVFDAEHSRKGYNLNMFCMSLNDPANREEFRADEGGYLDKWDLTPEQKQSVLDRDWLEMIRLGGNIYYTYKIGACDGLTFSHLCASMSGMEYDKYLQMMVNGGRSPNG